jgi:uncharacterized membrane protein YphA (DoxX/SURF4 family)
VLIVLAVVRTLIGLLFAAEGVAGFVSHDAFSELFTRWQIPYPDLCVPVVAVISGVCGVLLMIGWFVRPAALTSATMMVGVTVTGGHVDGGAYVIVPQLLFAALLYYAWRSGRFAGRALTRRPRTQ